MNQTSKNSNLYLWPCNKQKIITLHIMVMYLEYFEQAFSKGYNHLLNINLKKTGEALYNKTLLTVWKLAVYKLHEHGNQVAIYILNIMVYMDGSCINVKTILFCDVIVNKVELNGVLVVFCEFFSVTILILLKLS